MRILCTTIIIIMSLANKRSRLSPRLNKVKKREHFTYCNLGSIEGALSYANIVWRSRRCINALHFKMASSAELKGGYDFVEKPSEEFFCPVTLELLTDPVQTNFCCGNHLSRAAAEQLQVEGKPCPICQKRPLKTTDDMFFKRKMMELKVYCKKKSAGCKWQWELGELDNHLNLGSVNGQCEFVKVHCPLKCGQSLRRRHLEKHQSNECPKRPFSCQYCDCKSTYEKVVNDHWPKCQCFPKVCPNKCSTDEIEQRFLQHHLKEECPLQYVACEFSFAGCQVKVERKYMHKHLDENKDKHLKMTASGYKELKAELTDLKLALDKIAPEPVFIPPPDMVMNEYERRRKENEHWYSPAFYTHVGGYKMCLFIDANGWDDGEGTHVGVGIFMMKGEFDSHLKWPFQGKITVELVNQKEAEENYEDCTVQQNENDKIFQRVTEGERANTGWGKPQFISHTELYKPEEGKEYLLNDTLIFRITKIKVTSI